MRLEQILKRYDGTPFEVTPSGPVAIVARKATVTVRGWSERMKSTTKDAKSESPQPIELVVEVTPVKGVRLAASPQLSLSTPPAPGLKRLGDLQETSLAKQNGEKNSAVRIGTRRFVSRLEQIGTLKPADVIVPVQFTITTRDSNDAERSVEGKIDVVVPISRVKKVASADAPTTGVALIGGTLDLGLGHLCDQRGCVDHFHQSIRDVSNLVGVRPFSSLKTPRAQAYLRDRQPFDVWGVRERLRDRGVEVASLVPRDLKAYSLRIELPRWKHGKDSREASQCLVCRQRAVDAIGELSWSGKVEVAGGGLTLRDVKAGVNLVELLDRLTEADVLPQAVWLVPNGVAMPKSAPPRLARRGSEPKQGGSQSHPVVEFDFLHACDVGSNVLESLGKQPWVSRLQLGSNQHGVTLAAAIGDRKYAALTPYFRELRTAGRRPRNIRLSGFGEIRIQVEFSHVCGEVDYSKPPKPKKKPKNPPPVVAKKPGETDGDKSKPKKQAKPFVPKPLRPAKTSNGRQAIEAAVANVGWVKQAIFHKYHTKPAFKGPTKLMLALQAKDEDVVRLDDLIEALRRAGFPPKSVTVSRLFPGIPFGKPLPNDLELIDAVGNKRLLSSFRQPKRPLAVAFIALKSKKHKKYQADPKHYKLFAETIEKYKDRVDFVAVSANPDDKFSDAVTFFEKTDVKLPLLHDSKGQIRAVFNSQAAPAPHLFVFDSNGLLRYSGEPHDNWENSKKTPRNYLDEALPLILAGEFLENGAVFFNRPQCNCSDPKCKCPKCGCGPTCRCSIKHCGVGF